MAGTTIRSRLSRAERRRHGQTPQELPPHLRLHSDPIFRAALADDGFREWFAQLADCLAGDGDLGVWAKRMPQMGNQ